MYEEQCWYLYIDQSLELNVDYLLELLELGSSLGLFTGLTHVTQPACLQNNGASCEHETEQSQLGHMGAEPLILGSLAPFINQGSPRVKQLVVHLAGGVTMC